MTTKFRQTETPAGITVLESEQAPESSNRRKPDSEIQMLARIDRLLSSLDDGAAKRIMAFLASRYFGGSWTLHTTEPK